MTKKLLTLLFVLMLSIMLVFAFASCGGSENPSDTSTDTGSQGTTPSPDGDKGTDDGSGGSGGTPDDGGHTHSYGEWVTTKEATCTEAGEKKQTCSCGDIKTETIAAKGHSYGAWESIKDATCNESGERKKSCPCGDVKVETVNATDIHNYVDRVCTECGKKKPSEGLEFGLVYETNTYELLGLGTCKDTEIVVPSKYENLPVTSIGNSAFWNATEITSIIIPDSITSLGDCVFEGCTSLIYNELDNGCYLGSETNPYMVLVKAKDATITSCTVSDTAKFVCDSAFNGCTLLESVAISSSVTKIGNAAFFNCAKLTSITMPEGVTEIGYNAFYGCTQLASMTIPNSVTMIGQSAFNNCSSLKTLVIGNGVKTIPGAILKGCSSLESLTIPFVGGSASATNASNSTFLGYIFGTSSYEGSVGIYQENNGYPYSYYHIPKTLKNVVVTGGSILKGAFSGCKTLEKITVPNDLTVLEDKVFYNCESLNTVIGLDNLTKISNYAFSNCHLLRTFTIPKSVTTIGEYAFSDCKSLQGITLPDGVTAIESNAFSNCSSLQEITIPNGVTAIGSYAFSGCSLLSRVTISDGVTKINSGAFSNCPSITSIVIPKSITTIESEAFYNCYKLIEVYNLSNLDIQLGSTSNGYVGYYAKVKHTSLDEASILDFVDGYVFITLDQEAYLFGTTLIDKVLSLPESYKGLEYKIYQYAFYNNGNVSKIVIPAGVKSVGNYAFAGLANLREIEFNAVAMNDLSSGNYVFYKAGRGSEGITVTFGKDVTRVPAYLFRPSSASYPSTGDTPNIINVIFEEGSACEVIARDAFQDCYSLLNVQIPNSLKKIESYAFYNCNSIEKVDFSGSAADWCKITFESNPLNQGADLYFKGELVTEIVIPAGVEKIPDNAFSGCTSVKKVVISSGVRQIGEGAFSSCTALEDVTISDDLLILGKYAFVNCPSLKYNEYENGYYLGNEAKSYLVFIKAINTDITTCTIHETTKIVDSVAFNNCTALAELKVNAAAIVDLPSEYNVFYNAGANGIKVTIGKNVTRVPNNFFYRSNIISVEFEDGSMCKSIGISAFYNCESLKEVHISDIASWCNISFGNYYSNPLYYAKNLYINNELVTNLVIPNTVTKIKAYAFYNCQSLASITISDSVASIGDDAFCGCASLTEINFNAKAMSDFSSCVFSGAGQNGNGIKVIIGKNVTKIPKNLFYSDPHASSHALKITSVEFEDGSVCKSIGEYAFYNCQTLASITMPNSVASIGEYAFYRCLSLTSITIPDSVTSIGDYAFSGCTSLAEINFNATAMGDLSRDNNVFFIAGQSAGGTKVTIGKNVTKIPTYLFEEVDYITSVEVEDGSVLESIGKYAFYSCKSLTSITIPDSVTSIGIYAFYGCNSLVEINFNAIAMDDLSSGNYVFYNAGNGIKVTIGKNVTKIPAYLFDPYTGSSYSPNITSVVFEEGNICESIGRNAFSDCQYLESITGNLDSVVSIGYEAFYNCPIKTIPVGENFLYYTDKLGTTYNKYDSGNYYGTESNPYMILVSVDYTATTCKVHPDTVIINDLAFHSKANLTSVVLPNGLKVFNSSFYNATSLRYNQYDNAYYVGSESNPYMVLVKAKNENITSCAIHKDTKFIARYAFEWCTSLSSVTMPEGLVQIGQSAFDRCSSLTSITIPSSVKIIEIFAFSECVSLKEIYYNATELISSDNDGGIFSHYNYEDTNEISLYIGKNVKHIPENLLYDSLQDFVSRCCVVSVIFEEGSVCESIGAHAFHGCVGFESINLPNSITHIGEYAFYGCSTLKELTLPSKLTEINDYAFYGCSALESVTIHNGITSIGEGAFSNCTALKSVVIPNSVTTVGNSFSGCTSLQSLTIGEGVVSIGSNAFSKCTSLVEIRYNAISMKGFDEYSGLFAYCGMDKEGIRVIIGKNVKIIPERLFFNYIYSGEYDYYGSPIRSVDPYIVSVEFEEGSACETIGAYAFYSCDMLNGFVIPDSVKVIKENAFATCSGLTSITIGAGVKTIEGMAFYKCDALAEIRYNAVNMDDLRAGNNAFLIGAKAEETKLIVGKNVTRIPANLFDSYSYDGQGGYEWCEITIVEFEEGSLCTSIGERAFVYCKKLEKVVFTSDMKWTVMVSIEYASYEMIVAGTDISENAKLLNIYTGEWYRAE
ncbi:MAG: leucine-rich repeat protein [Clostridia bacterium]|nr:leucine-rich repeat protein [Clostridia bacterium]